MIKTNACTLEKEISTFLKKLEELVDAMDVSSFEKEAVICRGIVENPDEYYTMVIQASCEEDILFLERIVRDEQGIAMLKERCQGIKHCTTTGDKLHS